MVIYSNNLHEKLFGIAISKDYIKYNTPFCEFVEDPELEVDVGLAINFNKAINGNIQAAYDLTEVLTLSSGIIDWSTINFYVDKMLNIPAIFDSAITELQDRFTNPGNYQSTDDFVNPNNTGFRRSFQSRLNTALEDCLNSPCNIFAATSDSIGRLSQPASTKTDRNTFGVGTLSSNFTNIINGLDQTVYNKIPAIFQNAFIDITQLTQKAVSNTQSILAGKKDLNELIALARNGNSMRDTSKTYRYTPDIKSYYDYSAAGTAILTQIKNKMGGCFDKFQHAYRYNPYENNLSTPMTVQTQQYNGVQYETDPVGVFNNTTSGQDRQTDATSLEVIPNVSAAYLYTDDMFISKTLILPSRHTGNGQYSVFGGFIDKDKKILYTDDLTTKKTGSVGDHNTMLGYGCYNKSFCQFCPSFIIDPDPGIPGITDGLVQGTGSILTDSQFIINKYSNGYSHNETATGFEKIHSPESKIFNDGVAVSEWLWNYLTKNTKHGGMFKKLGFANKSFVAARKVGKPNTEWKLFKIVDRNTQTLYNVDFTPAAYKHLFGKVESRILNKRELADDVVTAKNEAIKNAGWQWRIPEHGSNGDDIEVKICTGDLNDIKNQLKVDNEINTGGGWEEWLILGDSPIKNGGYEAINSKLLDRLVDVAKAAGYKLKLISGYRSPKYNTQVGGAKSSAHTRRNAVDITVSDKSYKERVRLIQIAIDKGIRGIGVYNTSLHFDIEGKRAWGPNYSRTSLPSVSWAQPVLSKNGYAIS